MKTTIIKMPRPGEQAPAKAGGRAIPDPPEDLRDAGREAWAYVWQSKGIITSHIPIAAAYARQADRAKAFGEDVRKRGEVCANRFGHMAPNPSADCERRAHAAMAALLRELGIDLQASESRPPRRLGTKG